MSNHSKSTRPIGGVDGLIPRGQGGATMISAPTFAFGSYLFIPCRQLLLKEGMAVRVGGRALDLLAAFVSRPGELLSKRELLEEAWPRMTVVEGNLKVHIAALRRALEDDADSARFIATINGRGYRFIAPVEIGEAVTTLSGEERPERRSEEVQPMSTEPSVEAVGDAVALLARALGSFVDDVPDEPRGQPGATPRRVLFIELTGRDEAWIEHLLARRQRKLSATR